MALSPQNSASPSSATMGMTWLLCSIDHSLSASIERSACSAGIILEPGRPARLASDSTSSATKSGTNKNRPPDRLETARYQRQLANIGDGLDSRPRAIRPLVVEATRQRSEPLGLEHLADGGGAQPRLRDLSISLISYTE